MDLEKNPSNSSCCYEGSISIPDGKEINHKTNIEKNCPKPDIHFAQKEVTELTEPSLLKSEFLEILSTMSGTIDSLDIKLNISKSTGKYHIKC